MTVYREQTAPLAAFYQVRGILVQVDGMGSVDEVTDRLVGALAARIR
jgi:adenylate kinase